MNCITCNKKIPKGDEVNCWHNHCQQDKPRCGDCAEIHEDIHLRCKD